MAAGINLCSVRTVVFDAVGTLIAPDPPPAEVYAAVAREQGSAIPVETVRERFHAAFRREEDRDRAAGWRTDATREEARWRAIVAATLFEVADQDRCFVTLWDYFADPRSWRVLPELLPTIEACSARRLPIGVASNFDGRLRAVLAGQPGLPRDLRLIISSEVGWRKPAKPFFDAVAGIMECPPDQILMVGDDAENDIAGARASGLQAMLANV